MRHLTLLVLALVVYSFLLSSCQTTSQVAYSLVQVPEEGGINIVKITTEGDDVLGPSVRRFGSTITWFANPFLAISPNGTEIAFLSRKNNMNNIMIKNTDRAGAAIQRTFRSNVLDFSWSPDGKAICFSEDRGSGSSIFISREEDGNIVQQITNTSKDYSPVFSPDSKLIYFTRDEGRGNYSIWSINLENQFVSAYSRGMTPYPVHTRENTILCTRKSTNSESEIWMVNYQTGVEKVLVSQPKKSFTTPVLSPDGQWVLCVGNSTAGISGNSRNNLDIYVIRIDGTQLTQLTYHPADDASPVWAPDGKSIYFLSQRGNENGAYNVWKMDFNL